MGIDKLNTSWGVWNKVITLCKINRVEPAAVLSLVQTHIDKEFYGGREPKSFWIAALYQDRLTSRKETGYEAQEYMIRNHGPLIDDRFYGKSVNNIYWGQKTYTKEKEISTAHNLRQKIRGIHKRAVTYTSWKEFYTKIWPRIKKSKEFIAIIKLAKFK